MTLKQELAIGTITFISTTISGNFLIDLVIGIIVYSSSRLFYYYFSKTIIKFIDKAKAWWLRQRERFTKKK